MSTWRSCRTLTWIRNRYSSRVGTYGQLDKSVPGCLLEEKNTYVLEPTWITSGWPEFTEYLFGGKLDMVRSKLQAGLEGGLGDVRVTGCKEDISSCYAGHSRVSRSLRF